MRVNVFGGTIIVLLLIALVVAYSTLLMWHAGLSNT